MERISENISRFINQITQNELLLVSSLKTSPAYLPEEIEELEQDLEVGFGPVLKSFFTQIGGLSLSWTLNKAKLKNSVPDEEIDYVAGAVQILNPFEMVMGKAGTRWKDVLWYEEMDEEQRKELQAFLPFDFASTELITGFKLIDKHISSNMFLYDSNNGVLDLSISLEDYLEKLFITKGYYYWQEFLMNKDTEEYIRFVKYMSLLFNDFNVDKL